MKIPKGYVSIPTNEVGMGFRVMIKNDLTIVAESSSSFQKEQIVHQLWVEDGESIGVPRGYYLSRLKHRGIRGNIKVTNGQTHTKHYDCVKLRDGQGEIIDKAINILTKNDYGGCVIEAGVGSGKTIMMLEIARRLGLKTLIIVHTTVLFKQWNDEIRKFFPDWKIGTIQGQVVDTEGKDICIGMLQSLSLKDDYPDWLYEEFGTILVDEVHLTSAPEFSKGIPKFSARYIVSASGTVKRKDKCENVFINIIGEVLPFLTAVKTMIPEIYFIDTGFAWKGWNAPLDKQRVKYLSKLVTDSSRNLMIARQAIKAVKANRSVLILTERVNHANDLASIIKQQLCGTDYTVGVMTGSTKESERIESQKANIICATVQLIGTGFNEPRLSVLIFATPCQNITQAIGRVTRTHPNKPTPLVLDLVDTRSKAGMIFAMSRFKKYIANNWQLHNVQCFPKEFLWKYKDQLQKPNVVLRSQS